MHPRSRHWHLIDYIITRKKDANDFRVTKAMCGAECWTDHRLIISKVKLHLVPKRRPQGSKTLKKLHVDKLKDDTIKNIFCKDLQDKLESDNYQTKDTTIDKHWEVFRDIVHSTAHTHLGTVKRRNQD